MEKPKTEMTRTDAIAKLVALRLSDARTDEYRKAMKLTDSEIAALLGGVVINGR